MNTVNPIVRQQVLELLQTSVLGEGRSGTAEQRVDHYATHGTGSLQTALGSGLDATIAALQQIVASKGGPTLSADQLRERLVGGLIAAIDAQTLAIPTGQRDPVVTTIQDVLGAHVIGQLALRDQLLVAMLTGGNMLLEGVPGGGKTHAIRVLRAAISGEHSRVQLTPGTTIEELTGVYDPQRNRFSPGGLFAQIVHLDEVNRTKQKIQAAFMQAMAEGEITVEGQTHRLPDGFIVFATQNPAGDVGTFPLSPAMLDRFQTSILLTNGSAEEQKLIAMKNRVRSGSGDALPEVTVQMADILAARARVQLVHIPEEIQDYAIALKDADPKKERVSDIGNRGLESLYATAQALAYIDGRSVVSEADVRKALPSVLRHRIELTFEAKNAGRTPESFIQDVIDTVPVPSSPSAV